MKATCKKSFEQNIDLVQYLSKREEKSKSIVVSLRYLRLRKSRYENIISSLLSKSENSKLSRKINRKINSLNICIRMLENRQQRLKTEGIETLNQTKYSL